MDSIQQLSSWLVVAVLLFNLLVITPVKSVAYCPTGCVCDDENLVVNCDEGHLDVLPIALNPSIQRLVIKNNKIKIIDSSIQFYAELNFLDLSYNHLHNMPQKTFIYQKKLRELHLSHNKISFIPNNTFVGLSELTVLNLKGNFLTELNNGIFAQLTKLEELNVGQNSINYINDNTFDGLISLRVLYLDDNTLTQIPSNTFVNLKFLAELNLGINSFSVIKPNTFKELKGLQRLDLKGAGAHNITSEAFNGLDNLRLLDLSDNRLKRIPTVQLATLHRLEHLAMGQNDFEVVPEGAFAGLHNLRRLEISGSLKLRKIESGAFATNTNLEFLTVTSNKGLQEVEEGAFSGLPKLKHVILKDNSLTSLAEGLFQWNDLEILDLSENPIRCDCHMLWLKNILSRNASTNNHHVPVLCASPEQLRDQPLKMVTIEILGCSFSDSKRQAMVGVLLVGAAAIITALSLILYRFRHGILKFLRGGSKRNALSSKEKEYQKAFSDDEYISRYQYPCSFCAHPTLSNYPHHHNGTIRPMPITEL